MDLTTIQLEPEVANFIAALHSFAPPSKPELAMIDVIADPTIQPGEDGGIVAIAVTAPTIAVIQLDDPIAPTGSYLLAGNWLVRISHEPTRKYPFLEYNDDRDHIEIVSCFPYQIQDDAEKVMVFALSNGTFVQRAALEPLLNLASAEENLINYTGFQCSLEAIVAETGDYKLFLMPIDLYKRAAWLNERRKQIIGS